MAKSKKPSTPPAAHKPSSPETLETLASPKELSLSTTPTEILEVALIGVACVTAGRSLAKGRAVSQTLIFGTTVITIEGQMKPKPQVALTITDDYRKGGASHDQARPAR